MIDDSTGVEVPGIHFSTYLHTNLHDFWQIHQDRFLDVIGIDFYVAYGLGGPWSMSVPQWKALQTVLKRAALKHAEHRDWMMEIISIITVVLRDFNVNSRG